MIKVGWTIYLDRFRDRLVSFCRKASDLFGILARREVSNPTKIAVVSLPFVISFSGFKAVIAIMFVVLLMIQMIDTTSMIATALVT